MTAEANRDGLPPLIDALSAKQTDFSSSLLMRVKSKPVSSLVLLVASALTVTLSGCGGGQVERRPNIVLIMADDLGYETIGANGGSYLTPRIDALARDGMRFTQAYATPLCTPTRVQLMTGKYNFRNYIGFGLLDSTQTTFADLFRASGYRTAVVGKWQLWGNSRQREMFGRTGSLPHQAGFDESVLWQVRDRYGPRYKDPYLEINGDSVVRVEGAYGPDVFAESAEAFMERNRDRPFLLYYPMALTHDPFQPTPDSPAYAMFDSHSGGNDTAYFASNVAHMDQIVGRLVDKLEELGLRERTLVLFTGDNGTDRDVVSTFGDRAIRGDKGNTTTAGTHVPLIASWTGVIAPGQINDNLIDFTDFFPTLLDASGLPGHDSLGLDGLSFHPQLTGTADTVRSWIYCYYAPQWGGFEPTSYAQTKEWKLYEDGKLYRIDEDVDETTPIDTLSIDESAREIRGMLESVIRGMQ